MDNKKPGNYPVFCYSRMYKAQDMVFGYCTTKRSAITSSP